MHVCVCTIYVGGVRRQDLLAGLSGVGEFVRGYGRRLGGRAQGVLRVMWLT